MATPASASTPLSEYVQWYFCTLRHPDLLYYRWTLSALVCGYLLCALVFVPRVAALGDARVAWSVLGWGSLSAAVTLVAVVALRFVDPGSVAVLPLATEAASAAETSAAASDSSTALCPHCRTVHAARTRYCRRCQLCTRRYDHHCAITDLCIGQSNYRLFLLALLGALSTACLGTRLTYHLVLALLAVQPLYHPRSLLAVVTCACIGYAAFLLATYVGVHGALLFSNRTMAEMWAKRKERRRRGEWSVTDRGVWRRRLSSIAEVVMGAGQPMRCVELRDKSSALSHEERQAAEGWTDEDANDAQEPEAMGCVPVAAV